MTLTIEIMSVLKKPSRTYRIINFQPSPTLRTAPEAQPCGREFLNQREGGTSLSIKEPRLPHGSALLPVPMLADYVQPSTYLVVFNVFFPSFSITRK